VPLVILIVASFLPPSQLLAVAYSGGNPTSVTQLMALSKVCLSVYLQEINVALRVGCSCKFQLMLNIYYQ
jgi:hypothetical protein